MGVHPGNPVTRFAATIAGHARQITRAHTRLDSVQSTVGQHTAQIATANTNIATNTANITTANTNITTNATNLTNLDSRLGGSSQENYLSTLAKATAPSNPAHSGIGTIGHISGAPTQSDFNNLVDDYNATNTCVNNLVDTVATLISRLGASNILT